MKVLVTSYNPDRKIMAIKGVRYVALDNSLKACKDFVDGPLPAELKCRSDLRLDWILGSLREHGVEARSDETNLSPTLRLLDAIPGDLTVRQLRAVLRVLEEEGA